jgi:ABC-2 type transport system permease protein
MKYSRNSLIKNGILGFKKPLAFITKDFISAASYKFSFLSQFVGIFVTALAWFFLSSLFGGAVSKHLDRYDGDYFAFVIIGIAFANYLQVALRSFSASIRTAQTLGTLEAMLVTQTSIPTIIISSSLYNFILTSFRVVVYLGIGVFAFGLNIGKANYTAAIVVLLITIICFSSMGILSASFIMVLKKGNPLSWIFINLSWLLGGVYYPISVLPGWLEKFSYMLPITYSLEAMRLALLNGYSFRTLLPQIIPLLIFTVIMLPVSLYIFNFAVKRAKIEGSLVQY